MRKVYFLLFILISSFQAIGQGSIAGKVTDSKTNEGVIGANVVIVGTTQGAATDLEGNFLISNVKEGTYTLQVSSVMYKTHTVQDVKVETAKKITLEISVSEDVSELQEVVVTGRRQTDTDFDMLRTIRESKVIAVGITSEQISKTLDRDAAQVLRRVPGVTIRGDQFVQVRGLSERYNPVMLHNVYAPSVETDVRSFSFATLPSSQLDRMLIFKSPAADLPGDFAGGVVKVFTKSIPEENSFVIDYSTQVRAGTTFRDYYGQERNPGHFTGFNTGYYDLPSGFPANLAKSPDARLTEAGRSLPNTWAPVKSMAIPDQRLTLTYSKKFHIGKTEVGNITALNYSNAFSIFEVRRGDFLNTNDNPQPVQGYDDKQYNQQVRSGLLFNWAFKFDAHNIIELKNLYNQSSNDQYVDRTGVFPTEGQKNASFDKVYRGIYTGQVMGTHELFDNRTTVEWVAGYNNSNRSQPDYRRYMSNIDGGTGLAQISIPNTVVPNSLGRFYANLDEQAYSGGLSIKQRFGGADPLRSPELKAGVFFENKDRTFGARNIGYTRAGATLNPALVNATITELFQPQNINTTNGIKIGEITYRKDSYSASNSLLAYYLMGSIPMGEKIKLEAGARIENNLQILNSYDDFQSPEVAAVNVHNQVNRVLPSANLSYNFTEKMLVRAAYGETLNRPEFRELAPFTYYDFNFNFLYRGDKNLKTAKIQNMDLRWEFYPSKGEMITFGGFYKNFENPIEVIVNATSGGGGGGKDVNYQNAGSATTYGVEVEIKKSLFDLTNSKLLNNLNVLFNASLIKSVVTGLGNDRPLQGQAPYVINAGAFYTSEASGWQVNLLYNVVGKNIILVGNKDYHDVYLMPRNVVDITFNKRLSDRFSLKGGITDIFNQPLMFLQDGNGDGNFDKKNDQIIQSYRPGQVFSIGFSYRM